MLRFSKLAQFENTFLPEFCPVTILEPFVFFKKILVFFCFSEKFSLFSSRFCVFCEFKIIFFKKKNVQQYSQTVFCYQVKPIPAPLPSSFLPLFFTLFLTGKSQKCHDFYLYFFLLNPWNEFQFCKICRSYGTLLFKTKSIAFGKISYSI